MRIRRNMATKAVPVLRGLSRTPAPYAGINAEAVAFAGNQGAEKTMSSPVVILCMLSDRTESMPSSGDQQQIPTNILQSHQNMV